MKKITEDIKIVDALLGYYVVTSRGAHWVWSKTEAEKKARDLRYA